MSNSSVGRLVKLLSDNDWKIFEIMNFVVIVNTVSVLGVVGNVMNMMVFYKQGFASTMNISFFGLAISDLCGLLTLLYGGLLLSVLFIKSDVPMDREEVYYLSAANPHTIFSRITGWITVYITAERCLCILLPLKIKQIVTPRGTTVALSIIYVLMMLNVLPKYSTTYLDWKFYPDRNMSLIGRVSNENSKIAEACIYIIFSILGSASFVAVIVFTVVLVVQLRQKSKWRKTANADKASSETISSRDRKTMNMVVMIAIVLIVCYTPGTALSLVTFIEPEFSIAGVFVNLFWTLWSFAFVFDVVNSSINIFLYYRMSSKYRETFNQLFGFENTIK